MRGGIADCRFSELFRHSLCSEWYVDSINGNCAWHGTLSTSLHCLTLRSLWFECLFFLFWGSVSGAYGWMGNEGGNLGRGYIGWVLGERFYD